jgi:hypothetical protein
MLLLLVCLPLKLVSNSMAANGCTFSLEIASWSCCGKGDGSGSLLADGQVTAVATIHARGSVSPVQSVLWKLVGNDTRGCDIEPIIEQKNHNNPAKQATITAGSQNGPITVKATVSFHCGDSPPYDDTIVLEANLELCGATDDESGPNGCGICG